MISSPLRRRAGRLAFPCALLAMLVGGCASLPGPQPVTPPVPKTNAGNPAPPANVNLSGYPLPFRQGYADGCATATSGAEQKSAERFGVDSQYRQGWLDGRAICGKRPR